jgi:diaminopimelate epimerase
MYLKFSKYHGTGNDFIIVDNWKKVISLNQQIISKLCHRRFGIGADGLMLLQPGKDNSDFEMIYYNADGNESTMCGNGGRCIAAFAFRLKIIKNKTRFLAVDGIHEAELTAPDNVRLKMNDVSDIEANSDFCFLNTGSPHYVKLVDDISGIDVFHKGREIRYSNRFGKEGTNVNFVRDLGDNTLFVRTYERGVENETLSCGTGVVAAAISLHYLKKAGNGKNLIKIKTSGGNLTVSFNHHMGKYTDIWLEGPATFVFEGEIEI